MMKSAYVIAAAVLVPGGVVALASLSQVQASAPVLGAKGDRVDARTDPAAACSAREWPYFEAACLRQSAQATVRSGPPGSRRSCPLIGWRIERR